MPLGSIFGGGQKRSCGVVDDAQGDTSPPPKRAAVARSASGENTNSQNKNDQEGNFIQQTGQVDQPLQRVGLLYCMVLIGLLSQSARRKKRPGDPDNFRDVR